jgi:hypothetical protein
MAYSRSRSLRHLRILTCLLGLAVAIWFRPASAEDVNQIFGFDPDVQLTPTNTFHVGFWFNDPNDAAACGFTGFTPFNGEHHAGPLAMISLPNPDTGLGPLCLTPNTETDPISCNP